MSKNGQAKISNIFQEHTKHNHGTAFYERLFDRRKERTAADLESRILRSTPGCDAGPHILCQPAALSLYLFCGFLALLTCRLIGVVPSVCVDFKSCCTPGNHNMTKYVHFNLEAVRIHCRY